MTINPLEFEDSLCYLSNKQQKDLLSALPILSNAKNCFYNVSLKTLVNIITSTIPFKNFIKFNYGEEEQVRKLEYFLRYHYYPKDTIIYESNSKSLGEQFNVLTAGKVELSKNSLKYSLTHLMLQMKKYNLEALFTKIAKKDFEFSKMPETINEEFEILDLLVDNLKIIYMNHDNYELLELNKYRKTSKIVYFRPGECWGLEEIMNNKKQNARRFSMKTITNVHLLRLEKDILITILGFSMTKTIKERYKFIMNLCPSVFNTSSSREILQKVRYIYPMKGQKIYTENNHGEYIYLILKGTCLLKKRVYIDIIKKFSTVFKKPINDNSPLKIKSFDNIILNKGAFAGIEIFFQETPEYDYTLEVANDSTLICEFHYLDFIECDLIEPMKKLIQQTNSIQENHMNKKLTTLNKTTLFVDYRNLTKSDYLIESHPELITTNYMNKNQNETPLIKAQLVRNHSMVINLPSRNNRRNILIKNNSFNKIKKTIVNKRIFSNDHLNAFITKEKEEVEEDHVLKITKKLLFKKKIINVHSKNRKSIKNHNSNRLINSIENSDRNSQLIFSLKNWNNSLHKENYITNTMKIPLVASILRKSPSSSTYSDYYYHYN